MGTRQNTFRNEVKVTEWAFDRMKEAFERVAKDEARQLITVQEIQEEKYRFPASHHRASGVARRRYDVILVPAL